MAAPAYYHPTPLSSSRACSRAPVSRSELIIPASLSAFPSNLQFRKSLTIPHGSTLPALKVLCLRDTKVSSKVALIALDLCGFGYGNPQRIETEPSLW
ncbi:hypothetical protein TIFTF001_006992 [Ficus carica]|uniref:Uncharacterized protein n=1 Tax=Ficus carica TaxID=3494 RepID=A0AA87ZPB8_FICCA|nr:hypothetical protein TIFTF001_006992 [Ficus carica]